jgi:uncharacterized protein (TIGR03435 family)
MPGFILTVADSGAKLKASEGEYEGRIRPGRVLAGEHASMKQLADVLSGPLRAPIENRTKLGGAYDFRIDVSQAIRSDPTSEDQAGDVSWRFVAAVRDQLGLMLKRQKISVAVTVIDHVEKTPKEN